MSLYLLPFRYKTLARIIILLSVLFLILGIVLTLAGYRLEQNATIEIPFYSPFLDISQYFIAIALIIWLFSEERDEDEYIGGIRLKSLFLSLSVTTGLIIINETIYFFSDPVAVDAIAVIILQLGLTVLLMKVQFLMNRSGAEN